MPRPKKNPVTDMPVFNATPVQNEPGVFETENTPSNVVQLRQNETPIETDRDWSNIDSILSDVVNFGA